VVGGGVRDQLLGRVAVDWDVATSAQPESILALFEGARYENRFGTVGVPAPDFELVEVTTFRRDHRYADHRRPSSVTFTDDIGEDLVRRDFTVNAIAWGRPAGAAHEEWVDPANGMADLRELVLRAVGDPAARFDEDALRLLRAARLAAQLGFTIEPATLAAMAETAAGARWISAERVGAELRRITATGAPSRALHYLAETGVLEHCLPELAAQIGVPQNKVPGDDLWRHTLATLDAAVALPAASESLRLTCLLHDIGKPATFADGHFIGHDAEGARLARTLLGRLAFGRAEIDHVAVLIANHMFNYEPRWSGAAVRRFIKRVGRERIDDLLDLRQCDNVGSGLAPAAGHLDELRARVGAELGAHAPLELRDLAVSGDDLIAELGIAPGPPLGDLLERLLGLVITDPAQNDRDTLLATARSWLA
jgi:tRNA nucleotidyltransferase (CCA-adding enzyme)